MADSPSWRAGKARAGVPAADVARGVRQAARPSEIREGSAGRVFSRARPAASREEAGWEGRHRRPAGSDAPRARRSWSLAPRLRRQPALEGEPRGLGALSASARTRLFTGTGEAAARMPGGAPCRAGDREAEDPEAPPCEDGLSAASAAAGKPAEATASGFPGAALASLPGHRQRCRPTSRRLISAPLCRAGWATLGLNARWCQGLFSPLPNGRGRVARSATG